MDKELKIKAPVVGKLPKSNKSRLPRREKKALQTKAKRAALHL